MTVRTGRQHYAYANVRRVCIYVYLSDNILQPSFGKFTGVHFMYISYEYR